MIILDGKPYRDELRIGSFISDGVEIFIDLYGSEFNKKPHFHFYTNDKSLKGCVGIYEAVYVPHKKYKDVLSDKQSEDLNTWIRSVSDSHITKGATYWELIKSFWNSCEQNKPVKDPFKGKNNIIPDYTKLNENWKTYLINH